MKCILFESIDSTNKYLKINYESYENLTIVRAHHQTQGRGRYNRKWIDNDDLLFSILIKDNLNNISDYSLVIASSVYKVLSKYLNNVSIKWPNDIMVDDNKLCGILLEAVTTSKIECVIIGVGINVNTDYFTDDLLIKASSMKLKLNKEIDKENLFNELVKMFEDDYNDYISGENDYINIIKENFYLNNKKVKFTYNNLEYCGIVKGISSDGNIIIDCNNKLIGLSSGEVTFENIYNK